MLSMLFGLWLGAIARLDLDTRRIPNAMVWPGGVAVAASAALDPALLASGAVAAVSYLGAFLLRQCGGGDVKLAFVLGAMLTHVDAAVVMVLTANLLQITTYVWHGRREVARSGAGGAHAPALLGGLVIAVCLLP